MIYIYVYIYIYIYIYILNKKTYFFFTNISVVLEGYIYIYNF